MSAKPTANARSRPRKKRGGLGLRWLAIATMTLFGAILLSWGFSSTGAPQTESRPSSRAAASTQPKYETREIRDIRTGHRVMADNPELADGEVPQEDITPETHRNLVFRQPKPDGGLVEFELIRSLGWIEWTEAEAGRTVALDLSEFGVEGPAEVVDIQPCPTLEEGPGRLVTGTFRHTAHNVIDVHIAGLDEPIGATANHPFWSEDRQAFVAAAELRPGESVLQADGEAGHVIRVTSTPHTATVFNIEVDGEHVYYVTCAALLVHNACIDVPDGTTIRQTLRQVASAEDVHHIATHYGKWGKKFRNLFEPAGIGFDDAVNKVKIRGHSGGHGWYNEYVFERLSNAVAGKSGTAYRRALVDELMELRWELKNTNLGDLIKATASPFERLNSLP